MEKEIRLNESRQKAQREQRERKKTRLNTKVRRDTGNRDNGGELTDEDRELRACVCIAGG